MQLMSWTIARLGSRFSLFLEPYKRRVLHSALGRFCDQPLDLQVGFIEPDGTRRVLPFTQEKGTVDFVNCEQFERFNSITYRGYSEKYNLRFEFNIHSVFYPQDELVCITPAFYLELRVSPVNRIRQHTPVDQTPGEVDLFLRLKRPDSKIKSFSENKDSLAHINMAYCASPKMSGIDPLAGEADQEQPEIAPVKAYERIESLNPGCATLSSDDGLTCRLPVSESGSGIKWRLVWAAHVDDPVLAVAQSSQSDAQRTSKESSDVSMRPAGFRYRRYFKNLDQVIEQAKATRDDRLSLSRRLEKLLEQSPTDTAEHHLQCLSFQSFLASTFWCDVDLGDGKTSEWFSVLEGTSGCHGCVDQQYNTALFYLAFWPKLLLQQITQWAATAKAHIDSGGQVIAHDLGAGHWVGHSRDPHSSYTAQNCDFLLIFQAFVRWTGNKALCRQYVDLVDNLAGYLVWNDRDASGFPTEEGYNAYGRDDSQAGLDKQYTYLAVKRAAALRAAADILAVEGKNENAPHYEKVYQEAVKNIEKQAWQIDHYVLCRDSAGGGDEYPWLASLNSWSSGGNEYSNPGMDSYCIHTADGLVLPAVIGQKFLLDVKKVKADIRAALRENLTRYGCGHTSEEVERLSVSQNMWRDRLADYLGLHSNLSQCYWDLQVASNTDGQSLGYCDTYIARYLCFSSRGVTSMGRLISGPRITIDRLSEGETKITVNPNRHKPQRWPLVPLADWEAGKIPVCVVDEEGQVSIEGQIDPVRILNSGAAGVECKK